MSTLEQTAKNLPANVPDKTKPRESVLSRFLGTLCSVRFGIILLILLGLACLIGMLIMQQNVDGFDRYYAELTPAQRLVYGTLGFFNIYHVWYFNVLLAVLSINIILASIDRFPKIWVFVKKPSVTVPLRWLKEQKGSESFEFSGENKENVIQKLEQSLEKAGFAKTKTAEKNGKTFIFAQKGLWNRFGFLAVHVALLTIFLGGFFTSQFGHTGQMPLTPGQTSDLMFDNVVELDKVNQVTKRMPFEVTCTDIQQKLIKNDGSISVGNTIDWLTKIRIKEGAETTEAVVQMNRPFDYHGYRFFQASFVPVGRARNINLKVKSAENGTTQDITIPRDGNVDLPDGTNIRFVDFRGNFSLGKENPDEDTSSYPNPAAILQITPKGDKPQTAYAFGAQLKGIPIASKPIGGYTFQLTDFEKVGDQHILSVQNDPGANIVYLGFTLLFLTLVAVFFFSHQRIWAAIEETSEKNFNVLVGGHTNRSQAAFDDKFKRLTRELSKKIKEA